MEPEGFDYVDGYRSSFKYHSKGTVNLILSAPHGGVLLPDDVPDRTSGQCFRASAASGEGGGDEQCLKTAVVRDARTDEFAERVANELNQTWGFKPFVIIGKWHRRKVDFNREILEGTLNHPEAIAAYENYHRSLADAIEQVNRCFDKGLLIDIHGHSQGNYTMIGYLLSGEQLKQNDLSPASFQTSIESLCQSNRNEVIRGPTSLGTIFERHDLGVVYPSSVNPKPQSRVFFSGGYITNHYAPQINTIQTELSYDLRSGATRYVHAKNFARAIVEYMQVHNLWRSLSKK